MKVAFVGKGGSGKSTLSWLFVNWLRSQNKNVLAIDADHNMDLTSLLEVSFTEQTPTFHKNHDFFRAYIGLEEDSRWSRIVLESRILPTFSVFPPDIYTERTSVLLDEKTRLMIVGLGSEDVLFGDRCAHGHSAPLKFYLPLLEEKDAEVIIDGVAGTDMLNFGLYCGADAVVVAVESHQNSVKVAEQIASVAKRSGIQVKFILNKSIHSEHVQKFVSLHAHDIIGSISLDPGIASYSFANVREEVKKEVEHIWNQIVSLPKVDGLATLRVFEQKRQDRKENK